MSINLPGIQRQIVHALTLVLATFVALWQASNMPLTKAGLLALVPGVLRIVLSQLFPSSLAGGVPTGVGPVSPTVPTPVPPMTNATTTP